MTSFAALVVRGVAVALATVLGVSLGRGAAVWTAQPATRKATANPKRRLWRATSLIQTPRRPGSLPHGERDDPGDHGGCAETPPDQVAFGEEARPEHRADEDADLPRRRDIRDRAHGERGQHEDVRKTARDPDAEYRAPLGHPHLAQTHSVAEGARRDDDGLHGHGRPVIKERRTPPPPKPAGCSMGAESDRPARRPRSCAGAGPDSSAD